VEIEQLIDSGRGFLADTILFLVFYSPTIDSREVQTFYIVQFIVALIFLKTLHLICQIRVTRMFEIGIPAFRVHVKLSSLIFILLLLDAFIIRRFYMLSSKESTFYTWILFDALTMTAMLLTSCVKYGIHLVDINLEAGWPGKNANIFYVELLGEIVNMCVFLGFMSIFFVRNPSRLPIYMMADIISTARNL